MSNTIEISDEQFKKFEEEGELLIKKKKKEFIKNRQRIWILFSDGTCESEWDGLSQHQKMLARNNIYITKEATQKADNKRLALGTIRKFIRENFLEFVPDWKNNQEKYQIIGWIYNAGIPDYSNWSLRNLSQHNLIFKSPEDRQKVLEGCHDELRVLLRD